MPFARVAQEALPIRIKGTQDGLMITVAESVPSPWIPVLEAEFSERPDFWRGGRVVLVLGGRDVERPELLEAMQMLERYGMRVWAALSESETTRRSARELSLAIWLPSFLRGDSSAQGPPSPVPQASLTIGAAIEQAAAELELEPEPAVAPPSVFAPPPEPTPAAFVARPLVDAWVEEDAEEEAAPPEVREESIAPVEAVAEEEAEEDEEEEEEEDAVEAALILKETLRSGRSVRHGGPVIILGDVNPGAEVLSGGDVIVWGKLRGLVHAGAGGNAEAVVCALDLNPTQLRIADKITVPPKDPKRQPVPEMAVIREGQIVAAAWRSKA